MTRLIASLAALLLLWFGFQQPDAAVAAVATAPAATHTYAYDGSVIRAPGTHITQRGPPLRGYADATAATADSGSRGLLALLDATTTPAETTCNDSLVVAQDARVAGTTVDHAEEIGGDVSSLSRWHLAAETGAARFAVNSAGEATMSLRSGNSMLTVSEHAAERMTERGVSIDGAEAALTRDPFPYFHDGVWKTGYYDPGQKLFLGSVDGNITTVITRATASYIRNLKDLVP